MDINININNIEKMEAPFTKEELRAMSVKEILALPKKCPRLHPYCLIGLHIDDARNRMDAWCKNMGIQAEILKPGQACIPYFNTTYYICELDENDFMIDVESCDDAFPSSD